MFTTAATASAIPGLARKTRALKDFLVYRVSEADGHYEIAGESALEIEARRFAGLMAADETANRTHYEAWRVSEPTLLFTTS